MQLNLNIPTAELTKQFEAVVKERYQQMANSRIEDYFAEKNAHSRMRNYDGVGTLFVREIVDKLLMDENIQAKIKKHIEHHFDRILEEATVRAMTHQANKIAFKDEYIKTKE